MPCAGLKFANPTILLGDFNAHTGNDAGVWKRVINQYDDSDITNNERLMLQLCRNKTLCITNTFSLHRDVHKNAW